MNLPSRIDAAYLAGIIDGEGSVQLDKRAAAFRVPNVVVSSNDLELLYWIRSTLGDVGYIVTKPRKAAHHRESYAWSLKGPRAVLLLAAIAPYMKIRKKRERADLIVALHTSLTKRNGQYTEEEREAKFAFEAAFFAL